MKLITKRPPKVPVESVLAPPKDKDASLYVHRFRAIPGASLSDYLPTDLPLPAFAGEYMPPYVALQLVNNQGMAVGGPARAKDATGNKRVCAKLELGLGSGTHNTYREDLGYVFDLLDVSLDSFELVHPDQGRWFPLASDSVSRKPNEPQLYITDEVSFLGYTLASSSDLNWFRPMVYTPTDKGILFKFCSSAINMHPVLNRIGFCVRFYALMSELVIHRGGKVIVP